MGDDEDEMGQINEIGKMVFELLFKLEFTNRL